MPVSYPSAHLLSLPLELRENIYDHLAFSSPDVLHRWDRDSAIHLSAACTPPLALLQSHSQFCSEVLAHFSRTRPMTLHVDAYAFARLPDGNGFTTALQSNHYLQNARIIDVRPTLNASVEILEDAVSLVVPVLLSPSFQVKKVIITWAEATPVAWHGRWSPWAYKACALDPLKDLVGKLEIEFGGVVKPPPAATEMEMEGLKKTLDRIMKDVK